MKYDVSSSLSYYSKFIYFTNYQYTSQWEIVFLLSMSRTCAVFYMQRISHTLVDFFFSFTILQAASKDYWCSRPEHLKSISVERWRNLTQPINYCTILNAPYEQLDAFNLTEYFTNETSLKFTECTSWEFDMSLIGKTIVSEWNMVCSKGYVVSIVESCFLAGQLQCLLIASIRKQ
jgi:hypothetical protein